MLSLKTIYLRAKAYYGRKGLNRSALRAWREIDRMFFRKRCLLFWMDLTGREIGPSGLPGDCRVERCDRGSELPETLIRQIRELYSEELQRSAFLHRFELGARLWCLKNETEYMGYIWTIEGRSMKPHYFFPLLPRDVHFDDGLVFPNYRGRGLLAGLITHVLGRYGAEGYERAFLEVHEWNTSSLRSVNKTGFVRFGVAKKTFRRGKCRVTWWL